ncbi:hypothetical protein ABK040_012919 [Willaertia magna]
MFLFSELDDSLIDKCGSFLEEKEAANCLLLSSLNQLSNQTTQNIKNTFLIVQREVENEPVIQLVLFYKKENKMLFLSHLSQSLLVDENLQNDLIDNVLNLQILSSIFQEVKKISGPSVFLQIFTKQFCKKMSALNQKKYSFKITMEDYAYELHKTNYLNNLQNAVCQSSEEQLFHFTSTNIHNNNNDVFTTIRNQIKQHEKIYIDLTIEWLTQFSIDSGDDVHKKKEILEHWKEIFPTIYSPNNNCILGLYFLLKKSGEEWIPVSLVRLFGETSNGLRFNVVYTPNEHRRKGYSERLMKLLCEYVFQNSDKTKLYLFADKHYLASNRLYQKVGFVVCDERNLGVIEIENIQQ